MKKKVMKNKNGTVSLKHAKIFKKISENIRKGKGNSRRKAMMDLGYSESYANSPLITKTKTWKERCETTLNDELLLKVHTDGLNAENTIYATDHGIISDVRKVPDNASRHRFLDTAYKLKSKYGDTTIVHKFGDLSDEDIEREAAGILSEVLGIEEGTS